MKLAFFFEEDGGGVVQLTGDLVGEVRLDDRARRR